MSHAEDKYLLITDIETTGLDQEKDKVLEVASILVNRDFEEISRFERIIRLTDHGLAQLRSNEYVLKMHEKSGLLSEALLYGHTHEQVHEEWERWLYTTVENVSDTVSLSGSGVGHFDFEWIKRYFPRLAKRLTYYPYDIGDFRRITTLYNHGVSVIPPVEESFVEGVKVHRAMADAQAHLDEFLAFRRWFYAKGLETEL